MMGINKKYRRFLSLSLSLSFLLALGLLERLRDLVLDLSLLFTSSLGISTIKSCSTQYNVGRSWNGRVQNVPCRKWVELVACAHIASSHLGSYRCNLQPSSQQLAMDSDQRHLLSDSSRSALSLQDPSKTVRAAPQ